MLYWRSANGFFCGVADIGTATKPSTNCVIWTFEIFKKVVRVRLCIIGRVKNVAQQIIFNGNRLRVGDVYELKLTTYFYYIDNYGRFDAKTGEILTRVECANFHMCLHNLWPRSASKQRPANAHAKQQVYLYLAASMQFSSEIMVLSVCACVHNRHIEHIRYMHRICINFCVYIQVEDYSIVHEPSCHHYNSPSIVPSGWPYLGEIIPKLEPEAIWNKSNWKL